MVLFHLNLSNLRGKEGEFDIQGVFMSLIFITHSSNTRSTELVPARLTSLLMCFEIYITQVVETIITGFLILRELDLTMGFAALGSSNFSSSIMWEVC